MLFVVVLGLINAESAGGKARIKERVKIDLCWEDYGRKSNSPEDARFIASVCEKLEQDLRENKNVSIPSDEQERNLPQANLSKTEEKAQILHCWDLERNLPPLDALEKRSQCEGLTARFREKYGHAP